jgi:serine/threonine protein kinase
MTLCINPNCSHPKNSDDLLICSGCASKLLLEGRYRVIQMLGEGGFSKTYEVKDGARNPKVLKVLTKNSPKAIDLFKQEAEILSRFNILGIPKGKEYFTFFPANQEKPLYCFVMEKINGENLEEWMEKRNNQPISENLALLWLKELTYILQDLHENQFFHRDIKPSNIMLKTDGLLVLIDFGIVREITQTYEEKLSAKQVTTIHTPGYAPLEQVTGQAVPQSDFFALGRTFVFLLTGKHPSELGDAYQHDPYTDELENWRDEAPDVSPEFADFIDKMIARPVTKRPKNTQEILQRLEELDKVLHPPIVLTWERYNLHCQLKKRQTNEKLLSDLHQIYQNDFFNSLSQDTTENEQTFKIERTLGDVPSWHSRSVQCVAISADEKLAVSGSDDYTLKVWNLINGEELYHLEGHLGSVNSLAISRDNELLVSGSSDKTIKLWGLKDGKLIKTLSKANKVITCVIFDPHKPVIYSGGTDGVIRTWNIETAQITHAFPKHLNTITGLAITPNGQTLISGSNDQTIIVGTNHTLKHSTLVMCLAVSSDGKLLVSGSYDGEIKLWDLDTGKLINTLKEHTASILSVAISVDGQIIASGSEDKTIKIWNLDTGEKIQTLEQNLGVVTSVAISQDGKTLISGSRDCSVKLWKSIF